MTAVLVTLVWSAVLCGLYLRLARARQILDTPNERSSHQQPTPHGGGVALVTAFVTGLWLAAEWQVDWPDPYLLLAASAILLSIIGVLDDLRHLPVGLRLLAYAGVCILVATVVLRNGGAWFTPSGWVLVLLVALALLWSLNLYNFMDGIDGIAALQAVLTCGSAALLSMILGGDGVYALFCLLLAAAHCGFLCWNWPPARLFMGDAGSVPTGFLLAGLALIGAVQGQLHPICWLILLAPFVTDATWTLLWRVRDGQRVTQPHRMHAYQRLSRHWGSHLSVDLLLLGLHAIWLFPLAWAVQSEPGAAFFLVILAYLPLLWGMAKIYRLT